MIKRYKVEAGIPIPAGHGLSSEGPLYPWAEMRIGDSFFVPVSKGEDCERRRRAVLSSGYGWGNRNKGERFVTRLVDGGVRVWRAK